jgi:exonuclease III
VGVFCFFMKLKIISWIIRGLHEVDKCMCIRNLLRVWKADLVALQETKREQFSRSIVRSLCNGQHYYWCQLDSRGASGDIVLIWDIEKIEVCVGNVVVACNFRSAIDQFEWPPQCLWAQFRC